MKMPWGKYKGEKLHTLPSAYLHWLATEAGNMDLPVVEVIELAADDEWQWREKNNQHRGVSKYGDD